MPKIYRARLTDCGNRRMLDTADVKPIIKPAVKPAVKPVIKPIRDSLARRTLVCTYLGAEYSSLRSVDDLQIFDNSNESQAPKMVCCYPGSAFIAEDGSDELKVFWMSSEAVGTSTIGDSAKMTSALFQSTVVLKARRRLAGMGL
jgi:hypothetical protein